MKFSIVLAASLAALVVASSASARTDYTGGAGSVSYGGIQYQPTFTFWPETIAATPLAGIYNAPGTYDLDLITVNFGLVFQETSGFFDIAGGSFGGRSLAFSVSYDRGPDESTLTIGGNTVNIFGTSVLLNTLVFDTPFNFSTSAPAVGVLTGTVAGTVPEPTTWAMMIGGFGMIGGGLRRRTVAAAFDRGSAG